MQAILNTNVIRLFDFYLLLMFVIGLLRRGTLYRDVVIVSFAAVTRQPNLVRRLSANRDVLLHWPTLRPVFIALFLMLAQFIMSRLIWPHANVTVQDLLNNWWQSLIVLLIFAPMFAVDVYFLIRVGQIDRTLAHEHLTRAEHWLTSWHAPAVKMITFGYVNPRKMVDEQLREGLSWFRGTMAWSMWWVTVQVGLRVMFGVTIWLIWASTIQPETV